MGRAVVGGRVAGRPPSRIVAAAPETVAAVARPIVPGFLTVGVVWPETVGPMAAADYASVSVEVASFLLDEQRGLEQFYAIVHNGVVDD